MSEHEMVDENEHAYTAFAGDSVIARGDLRTMLTGLSGRLRAGESRTVLVFEDGTGRQVDFDTRGTADEVVRRAEAARGSGHAPAAAERPAGHDEVAATRRGRPRLGVVSREVSLLPRHWEWLESQPNGISAALRRLVDDARRKDPGKERARRAVEAASRVMTALAGNREGYEEASRALFAGDREALRARMAGWPADVSGYLERLLGGTPGR